MTKAASRSRDEVDSCLFCHIRSEWMQADSVEFRSTLNRAFITTSENGKQYADTDAVFGASAYRLDAHDPKSPNSRVSAILHDQGRATWLDHQSRSFVFVEVPHLPSKKISSTMLLLSPPEQLEGKVREDFLARSEDVSHRNASVVRTILRDSVTRCDWTHYLICDSSLRVSKDLLKMFLTVLVGDPELQEQAGFPWERLFKAVALAGLPVAGGMLPVDSAATSRRGGSFRVEKIRIGWLSGGEFATPDNYEPAKSCTPQETGPQIRMNSDPFSPGGLKVRGGYPIQNGDPSVTVTVGNQGSPKSPGSLPAVIGLLVPQSALDSIRNTFNQFVLPLSEFSIGDGFLTIDWLAQMRSDWVARNGQGGTLVYCALHDEPALNPGDPVPAKCEVFTGKGLLDFLALQSAKDLVMRGTVPAQVFAALPPGAIAELAAAGTNWIALSSNSKMQIACSVLWQSIGMTRIPINQPPKMPTDPFNIDTPVASISIDQIRGTITMPPVTHPTVTPGTPVIEFRPVITNLTCRSDATIQANVSLASIDLQAGMTVTPSGGFWAAVGVASVVGLLFPPLAALSTIAAIAAIETLASGRNTLHVSCNNPIVSMNLAFRQDAQGLFGPVIASSTSAEFGILIGQFPLSSLAGIFDIVVAAFHGWINDTIFPILNQMITGQIYLALQRIFGDGFPHAVTKLGIPIIGGLSNGADNSHVYFEVDLAAVPGFVPPLKPPLAISNEQAIRVDLGALLTRPTPLRAKEGVICLSLNLSENAINDILAARYRAVSIPFEGALTQPADLQSLSALVQPPVLPSYFGWVVLDVLVPPVVTLSTASASEYATIDVSMSLTALAIDPISAGTGPIPGATWKFRVSSPVKIVLGATLNESGGPLTPVVDLFQFPNHIFDVLIDINNCGILLQSMSVVAGGPGESAQSITVTPAVSLLHEPLLRSALSIISGAFSLQREPRRDQIGAPPGGAGRVDRTLEQTYSTNGSDPDAGGGIPPLEFPVALGLHPSLLHMHVQLAGAISGVLDGTIKLGDVSLSCSFGRGLQHSQQQVTDFLQQP